MTAPTFEITSVTLHPEPRPLGGGVLLADLTIRYGALTIQGASLIRKEDGAHALMLPKAGRKIRVFIADWAVRQQLLRAACAAFGALAAMPLATAPVTTEPTP